jgi:hypothetical protein
VDIEMYRKHSNLLVVLFLVSSILGCAEPNEALKSKKAEADKSREHIQAAPREMSTQESLQIHLAIGSFDPLIEASPVELPSDLTVQAYPEGEAGYYILQFRGPVLQQWKKELVAAGVVIFDYIPQFAFLVRIDHQALPSVEAMDSVRWVGIYQPGYRIAPDLRSKLEEKENQSIELVLSIFKGEDISILRSRLERLGAQSIEMAPGEKKIKLVIASNRIDDLARLSGIRYIEKLPEFKLSPAYIKKRGK